MNHKNVKLESISKYKLQQVMYYMSKVHMSRIHNDDYTYYLWLSQNSLTGQPLDEGTGPQHLSQRLITFNIVWTSFDLQNNLRTWFKELNMKYTSCL